MPNNVSDLSQRQIFYISTSILQRLLSFTSKKGVKVDDLLKKANIDKSFLDNLDNKFPLEDYYSIMDAAIEMAGDDYFGLHMGESGDPGDISVLGYIMASCRNIREALEKFNKYFPIIGSTQRTLLKVGKDDARIIWKMMNYFPNKCIRHCIDFGISNFYNMISNFVDEPIEIKEMWLKGEPPDDISEYHRVFKCSILFNQPVTALIFPLKILDMPLRHSNPNLLSLLEYHANGFLSKIDEKYPYSKKISMLFFESIQGHIPTIEEIAKDLGVSVRVLQHKLRKEGVTFSSIADKVRQELAKTYLAEKRYTIDDITYLVGFSEPSVFRRAFKRWTGITASQYRAFSENKSRDKAANL